MSRSGTPPKVFKKNILDLDNTNIVITVTDGVATGTGQDVSGFVRDRKNNTGWGTTGSSNAGNTTFQALFQEERFVDSVFLIGNNFKNFTLEYYNGTTWVLFQTVTNNTDPHLFFSFAKITMQGIRFIVTETFVANDDKFLAQFIATEKLGEFQESPVVDHTSGKNRKRTQLVSGKSRIIQNSGAVEIELEHNNQINDNDLTLVEEMFSTYSGFLFWPCGGDESQFRTRRIGFRKQDIFLMAPRNEYENPWGNGGNYLAGTDYKIQLVEVV